MRSVRNFSCKKAPNHGHNDWYIQLYFYELKKLNDYRLTPFLSYFFSFFLTLFLLYNAILMNGCRCLRRKIIDNYVIVPVLASSLASQYQLHSTLVNPPCRTPLVCTVLSRPPRPQGIPGMGDQPSQLDVGSPLNSTQKGLNGWPQSKVNNPLVLSVQYNSRK